MLCPHYGLNLFFNIFRFSGICSRTPQQNSHLRSQRTHHHLGMGRNMIHWQVWRLLLCRKACNTLLKFQHLTSRLHTTPIA